VARSLARASLGLCAVLAIATAVVYGATEVRLRRAWPVEAAVQHPPLPSAGLENADPERGALLAQGLAQCGFCHGGDLGGRVVADLPVFGRLWAPNLTGGRGGLPADYDYRSFVGAVRHGVDRQGRSLALMPSDHLRVLPDSDLAAILSWIRSRPPVDRETPSRSIGPFTRLVLALGLAPELLVAERIDHAAPEPDAPKPGPDASYGAWLASVGLCGVCHGADLSGGLHPLALPGEPVPPDLRPGGALAGWSEADFRLAMRAGVTPDGRTLDASFMPWPHFALLDDVDLSALWNHLRSLPPAPAPGEGEGD